MKTEIAQFMAAKDIRAAIQSQNELAAKLNESMKHHTYVREFGFKCN